MKLDGTTVIVIITVLIILYVLIYMPVRSLTPIDQYRYRQEKISFPDIPGFVRKIPIHDCKPTFSSTNGLGFKCGVGSTGHIAYSCNFSIDDDSAMPAGGIGGGGNKPSLRDRVR